MHPFGDGVSAWVFYSSWDGFDIVTLKQLLEFVTCKFTAVVMDDGDRSRVTAKPFRVKEFGDIRGGEAFCGYKFGLCSCSVYYGKCLDLSSKNLFRLGEAELYFSGSDHVCVDGCPREYMVKCGHCQLSVTL